MNSADADPTKRTKIHDRDNPASSSPTSPRQPPRKRTKWIDLVEAAEEVPTDDKEPSSADGDGNDDDDSDDGDDNYLSAAFTAAPSPSHRPSPPPSPPPRKNVLSRRELLALEKEKTRRGLSTSLFDNQAHADAPSPAMRMMMQMGYGTTSSTSSSGASPVEIDLTRRGRAGIGRAGIGRAVSPTPLEKQEQQTKERLTQHEQQVGQQSEDYRARTAMAQAQRHSARLVEQARRVLADLDERRRGSNGEVYTGDEAGDDAGGDHGDDVADSDQLDALLRTLRRRHHYCLFCGCQYTSTEDRASACPGVFEDDHE